MQLEVYAGAGGHHRWRLISTNGQTVASSGQGFASRSNAVRAATSFSANAGSHAFEVYADSGGKHRWRCNAANGQVVAGAGEAFASQSNARRAADSVQAGVGGATGP
jgi:uncharacterized protein YegP (UPF0339 family)